VRVDIVCSVLNGARFLPEFLESLARQTHADWSLWTRDDGSNDATVSILQHAAASDSRIHVLHVGGPRLGVAGAYGWLLEHVPATSEYVMVGDADDVWLDRKIERTLDAMRAAEAAAASGTPILVHTDLTVADERLNVLHPSYWRFSDYDPEPATLRRLVIRNLAAAPTLMLNRPLRELIGATPDRALFQDWWYALVAAAFGRIVALREPTVLYRQHGANAVGARDARLGFRRLPGAIAYRLQNAHEFRQGVQRSAEQAHALLERYGDRLNADDREFLRDYSMIPRRGFLARKRALLRLRVLPELGPLRALGVLWRG
jgi:glycosyltransferase involved in cell wall biosynthesis